MLASPAFAQDYRSFSDLEYSNIDSNSTLAASTKYYFADQSTNGTLDEFGYLDTDSSMYAYLYNGEQEDGIGLGGEAFIGKFIVGGAFNKSDHENNSNNSDSISAKLGYLLADNFIISLTVTEPDEGDTYGTFKAEYDHSLGQGNYIGFTATIDDSADAYSLSGSYFSRLQSQYYVRAGLSYEETGNDDTLALNGAFYLNAKTSFNAEVNTDSFRSIGAKHYYNKNWAVGGALEDHKHGNGFKIYLNAQF